MKCSSKYQIDVITYFCLTENLICCCNRSNLVQLIKHIVFSNVLLCCNKDDKYVGTTEVNVVQQGR